MRLILLVLATLWSGAAGATPPSCQPSQTHHALPLGGETAGARSLFLPATGQWTLVLERQALGWQIQIRDAAGQDLSAMTPPRFGPNPRNLMGWHFRNADNSRPNRGEVNAPQRLRRFVFRTENKMEGRGWLYLQDYGLADLARGEKARMVYAKFSACLIWPKTAAEQAAERDASSTEFLPEEREIFGKCGLRPPYRLEAWITPRMLGGDIDGDDAADDFALITRSTDGKKGIALCRAGTWLNLLGFGAPVAGLPDGYLQKMEAWKVKPEHGGDILILERLEKSAYALHWEEDGLNARLQYGGVETGEPE